MNAKTFKDAAEATAILSALKGGQLKFAPITAFGRTTVKIYVGVWKTLNVDLFNRLVAA